MITPESPAFPFQFAEINADNCFGLSVREYFAAQVLQGLLAADTGAPSMHNEYQQKVAKVSVSYADALIVALNSSRNLACLPETESPDDTDLPYQP